MLSRSRTTLASLAALALAGTALAAASAAGPAGPADPDHRTTARAATGSVLAISIDGLNPQAIQRLGREGTPHLHEFMEAGASTLNARTEVEMTVTLPNHTGMVTGRRIEAAKGGHGVSWNDDRRRPSTVQGAAGHGVASVFSVVGASGGSSALFASKPKFSLWKRSWPVGIDKRTITEDNAELVAQVVNDLATTPRAFRFLHLSLPDVVGHARGFMSRPYLRAVRRVDRLLGRVVRAVSSDPLLSPSTTMVLTSDHGGRGDNHSDARRLDNYRIAFMVRGPGIPAGADLYELNPDYRDPHRGRPTYASTRQPVRNGDLANLSLDLLGLPPVPDSEHNHDQDLDVAPEQARR